MKILFLITIIWMTCIQLALGDGAYSPLVLFVSGADDEVRFDQPRLVPELSGGTFICLFQQGDGNIRILRSNSQDDCNNNVGTLIYHSGFSLELDNSNETYYTRLQHNGQLITRTTVSDKGVWKTHSSQGDVTEEFWLVLNEDDTLSILDANDTTIWNSATGKTRVYDRPLALMETYPNYNARVWFVRPIVVRDRLADSFVCLIQQGRYDWDTVMSFHSVDLYSYFIIHSHRRRKLSCDSRKQLWQQ